MFGMVLFVGVHHRPEDAPAELLFHLRRVNLLLRKFIVHGLSMHC